MADPRQAAMAPAAERGEFQSLSLDEVGYEYREETGNPAYRLFLR